MYAKSKTSTAILVFFIDFKCVSNPSRVTELLKVQVYNSDHLFCDFLLRELFILRAKNVTEQTQNVL